MTPSSHKKHPIADLSFSSVICRLLSSSSLKLSDNYTVLMEREIGVQRFYKAKIEGGGKREREKFSVAH